MKKNEMQCRDFREIADSYLSDELLIETNHEVLQHLENCERCRGELGARREVRAKLRGAVVNAPESEIDAAFAEKLRQNLEKKALRSHNFSDFFRASGAAKVLAITAAALIIAAFIGYNFRSDPTEQNRVAENNSVYKTAWTNFAEAATDDHTHCGIKAYDYWLRKNETKTAEEKTFQEKVLNRIRSEITQSAKLVSIHDCKIKGENFHHVMMNVDDHIVSITQPVDRIMPSADEAKGASEIFTLRREEFEVAGFTENGKAHYVVSNLPKDENRRIAEIFSGSLQARNAAAFKFLYSKYLH